MAIPSGAVTRATQIGVREDLSDTIDMIDPTDTPLLSMLARKGTAENNLFEWQTDKLAAASNVRLLEGDDAGAMTATPTVRVTNRTQITGQPVYVSGTAEAVKKAGAKSEFVHQMKKAIAEVKQNMEFALCQNTTAIADNGTVGAQTRGLEGFIEHNTSLGSAGDPADAVVATNTAPTDGTAEAFTETRLKAVLQSIWDNGGKPDTIMLGAKQKEAFSGFDGISTKFEETSSRKTIAAVDIYVSDWGQVKAVPNRFQRARTVFVLQSDNIEVMYLRPLHSFDLAVTGDSKKKMVLAEYGLKVGNTYRHGAIRDCV